jgi:hypothetical protein
MSQGAFAAFVEKIEKDFLEDGKVPKEVQTKMDKMQIVFFSSKEEACAKFFSFDFARFTTLNMVDIVKAVVACKIEVGQMYWVNKKSALKILLALDQRRAIVLFRHMAVLSTDADDTTIYRLQQTMNLPYIDMEESISICKGDWDCVPFTKADKSWTGEVVLVRNKTGQFGVEYRDHKKAAA